MQLKLFQNPIWLLLLFCVAGCKQEYYPEVKSSEQAVLVVDGIINSGNGLTTIRVTRSLKLSDAAQLQPEINAQVTVEGKSGAVYPLEDFSGNGLYSAQLFLDPAEEYRLHIVTTGGNEYLSDYVHVQNNPPVDSVSWKQKNGGVEIDVSTHNADGASRYFRWEYEETWEMRSVYFSFWKLADQTPVPRLPDEYVYTCWRTTASSNINLGTSTQLASNVIFEKPLIFIQPGSEKLDVRYSVLVRQYVLDKEGYAFYQLMQKNTESLGSLFDAQPSELRGNIHAVTDPSEPVIGYVTICASQEARLFISKAQIPDWEYRMECGAPVVVPNNPDSFKKYFNGGILPYAADEPFVTKFYAAPPTCVDCTRRGGVTQRPDFW